MSLPLIKQGDIIEAWFAGRAEFGSEEIENWRHTISDCQMEYTEAGNLLNEGCRGSHHRRRSGSTSQPKSNQKTMGIDIA